MMLQFTLAMTYDDKPIFVRKDAILAVYYGCLGTTEGTYIQVGMQVHLVKESVEEVMQYLKD